MFVSYIVWLFGAFTIIFVLSRTTQNILIAAIILLTTSAFLIYIFHQITSMYGKMYNLIEKQTEQIKQLKQKTKNINMVKEEFIDVATSNFRGPVQSLKRDIRSIMQGTFGKVPPRFQPVLKNITTDIKRLSQSLEKHLTVSKIINDSLPYKMSDFNIKTMSEDLVDTYRRTAMQSGISLRFKSDVDHKGIIHADSNKTKQILTGLLENALAVTQQGMVSIFVSDTDEIIQINIKDAGRGYKPEELHNLFDKYHQAHADIPVSDTYTGLELYTARTLAKNMGGEVSATSEGIDTGTTFTVTFPIHL